jgi:hypothetical protein
MPFTTIDHDLRRKFNLTLNEYAIIDSIYYLSRNDLCSASKKYLGDFIGISKQAVHKILNKLESKNLIGRNTLGVKTSAIWDNEILKIHGINGKESLPQSKESLPQSKESLPNGVKKVYSESKESLHNKDFISTTNNNNISDDIISLTNFLYQEIKSNTNPPCYQNKMPDLVKWAADIEKLHRIDGQPIDEIKKVIFWTVRDNFWKTNILSAAKFREKYDTLFLQMNNKKNPQKSEMKYREREIVR